MRLARRSRRGARARGPSVRWATRWVLAADARSRGTLASDASTVAGWSPGVGSLQCTQVQNTFWPLRCLRPAESCARCKCHARIRRRRRPRRQDLHGMQARGGGRRTADGANPFGHRSIHQVPDRQVPRWIREDRPAVFRGRRDRGRRRLRHLGDQRPCPHRRHPVMSPTLPSGAATERTACLAKR